MCNISLGDTVRRRMNAILMVARTYRRRALVILSWPCDGVTDIITRLGEVNTRHPCSWLEGLSRWLYRSEDESTWVAGRRYLCCLIRLTTEDLPRPGVSITPLYYCARPERLDADVRNVMVHIQPSSRKATSGWTIGTISRTSI